ncbi:GNAT family N-acetyltransferase [Acinetobacter shaoyimingii]|uniref:GNAT family N-acetyltransferase n=1 Tax=Acinetobacter shaoyimingii TaxID=2715164 RepID=A0A6G8RTA2_9GAMM|nr:GNAT family N-acetyltransferase [Acinetobacter shaoyimingii]NHB59267.1 GNAT family N-acetyltransferase [Acinetobacter shaoyimingii]QIO05121.1 GNAT family N-acetyltransferase [Acinetobacter shaoyimingii]
MDKIYTTAASWDKLIADAMHIREQVFIQEQNIPEQDEWDDQDEVSLHFIAYALCNEFKKPIATARLLPNHSIGRVAVLKDYRGQGIGRLIMQSIIEHAKKEHREFLKLSSQVHAIQFYQSLGFHVEGTEYLDCGIPHIDMIMTL